MHSAWCEVEFSAAAEHKPQILDCHSHQQGVKKWKLTSAYTIQDKCKAVKSSKRATVREIPRVTV